jgi:hypothetical protein
MRRQAPQRGQTTLTSKPLSEDAKECEGDLTFAFSALFSLRFCASEDAKVVSLTFAEAGNVSRVKHWGWSVGRLVGGRASVGSPTVSSVAATALEAETAKPKQGLGFLEAVSTVSSVSASVKSAVSTSLSVR